MNEQRGAGRTGFGKVAKVAGVGFGALDGALYFSGRRSEHPDENVAKSALFTGGYLAAWAFAQNIMWAKTGVDIASAAGKTMREGRRNYYERQMSMGKPNFGGHFVDTEIAATARQRGMQAIGQSKLNARSAFTNQARQLHRF